MSKTNIRRVVVILTMLAIFLTGIYMVRFGGYNNYTVSDMTDIYEKFNQTYDLRMTVHLRNVDVGGEKVNFRFNRRIDRATDTFVIIGFMNDNKIYEEHSRVINFNVKETNDPLAPYLIFIDTANSVGQLGDKVVILNRNGEEILNRVVNKYSFDKETSILTIDGFNLEEEIDEDDDLFGISAAQYRLRDGKFNIMR